MTENPGAILTDEERTRLERGNLDREGHRALDAAVGYRVRRLAARPRYIDVTRVVEDVRLLAGYGHNATVALVRGRLGDHLPAVALPPESGPATFDRGDPTNGLTMNFDAFTGQVQHRLELADTGETLRTIRATLTTLGERLQSGEADDLASSLPMEIDRYLTEAESGQRFDFDEFVDRVREREGMSDPSDRADAVYHAKVVLAVVAEVTPPGELSQVRGQLPADFDGLFERVDAESP